MALKNRTTTLLLLSLLFICSCHKDHSYPGVNISDGIDLGEVVNFDNKLVTETLNMEGGDATVSGNTLVNADINLKDNNSDLLIRDFAVIHKINLSGGVVRIIGSPVIKTDFNINKGVVIIGTPESSSTDTVRILNNVNLSDSVWIAGGTVVIYKDFNQNGFVNIAEGAKVIVLHDMNKGADLYGKKSLEVKGIFNDNHRGVTSEEPFLRL